MAIKLLWNSSDERKVGGCLSTAHERPFWRTVKDRSGSICAGRASQGGGRPRSAAKSSHSEHVLQSEYWPPNSELLRSMPRSFLEDTASRHSRGLYNGLYNRRQPR